MALLTREERKSLGRPARRVLREKRRSARQGNKGRIAEFALDVLRRKAAALILDQVRANIPGHERMAEVLDELSDDADDILTWQWAGPAGPILELVDGPVIRAVVRAFIAPHVQQVYEHLHDAGILESER